MTPTDPLVDEAITPEMIEAGELAYGSMPYWAGVDDHCRAIYTAMRAVSQEGLGEKHDGQPIGVHAYECRKCGKDIDAMKADPVCKPPKADGPSTAADAQDDAAIRHALALIGAEYAAKGLEREAAIISQVLSRLSPVTSPDTAGAK